MNTNTTDREAAREARQAEHEAFMQKINERKQAMRNNPAIIQLHEETQRMVDRVKEQQAKVGR